MLNAIVAQCVRFKNTVIWSLEGWNASWRTEDSLKQWVILNLISIVLTFILPLSLTQQGMIVALGLLILAAELMNTALEEAIDYISLDRNPRAKKAKDAGSASVAITAIAAGVAWVFLLFDIYY
jgi:diacylglycerol kinase (ATP)